MYVQFSSVVVENAISRVPRELLSSRLRISRLLLDGRRPDGCVPRTTPPPPPPLSLFFRFATELRADEHTESYALLHISRIYYDSLAKDSEGRFVE